MLAFILPVLPALGQSHLPPDEFTEFTRAVVREAHHRHSKASLKDLSEFAYTAWMGCGEDPECAYAFAAVCADECGLDPLDNKEGCGWCGGTWATIGKVLQRNSLPSSREWIREHPWMVNELLARHFANGWERLGEAEILMCWNQGDWWRKNGAALNKAFDYFHTVEGIKRKLYPETGN